MNICPSCKQLNSDILNDEQAQDEAIRIAVAMTNAYIRRRIDEPDEVRRARAIAVWKKENGL